jgi:hypothetical protein
VSSCAPGVRPSTRLPYNALNLRVPNFSAMPTQSTVSRNATVSAGSDKIPRSRVYVSCGEVQAGQGDTGFLVGPDDGGDSGIWGRRGLERPPELDGGEPALRAACGRSSSGRSVNKIELFTV